MNEKIICIYKITNPTGKVYIGQTIDFKRRMRFYKTYHCKGQQFLFHSLKKYGWENHIFEVIERCLSIEEMNDREKFYISFYDSTNLEKGMNLQQGGKNGLHSEITKKKIGDKSRGRVMSEESKIKMSNAKKGKPSPHKGKKLSDEARKNMSNAAKGKIVSNETRKRMSEYRTGRKRPEHGILISKIQLGRKFSEETKDKIRQKAIGRTAWNKGIPHSEAAKENMRKSKIKKI